MGHGPEPGFREQDLGEHDLAVCRVSLRSLFRFGGWVERYSVLVSSSYTKEKVQFDVDIRKSNRVNPDLVVKRLGGNINASISMTIVKANGVLTLLPCSSTVRVRSCFILARFTANLSGTSRG
jgi:hypothetical protein